MVSLEVMFLLSHSVSEAALHASYQLKITWQQRLQPAPALAVLSVVGITLLYFASSLFFTDPPIIALPSSFPLHPYLPSLPHSLPCTNPSPIRPSPHQVSRPDPLRCRDMGLFQGYRKFVLNVSTRTAALCTIDCRHLLSPIIIPS